ncbi:hypothetical protein KFE25_014163 [Diacronema lutheri]|uniref:Feruloyl esterase n=1 Tax=Diacronema lutheri TaxID=2081491 RepID=A0A8J5X4P6_DIALT|nr:hypothetical protein KFE25_014163 [Diacronema lutheri]
MRGARLTRSSHEFLSAPLVPSSALGLPSGCVRRMFLLYVPSGHSASRRSSLVVLNPDIGRSPMDKLVQEVFTVAERLNSLLVVLDVVRHAFNVGADAQASGEDDVAYALAALRKVAEAVFVDVRRVYCTGYSRGGRFCAQLASELPALFAAIAPVASLRYPHPNNATRPISVIAFHGTSDPINPYGGGGSPYWKTNVSAAFEGWAAFDNCTTRVTEREERGVAVQRSGGCADGAEVALYTVQHMGHVWPGSLYDFVRAVGPPCTSLHALSIIQTFFARHALLERYAPAALALLDTPTAAPG